MYMRKTIVFIICFNVFIHLSKAQLGEQKEKFTHADTLRGSLNPNRTWWDVLRYDIEVKPDYQSKTIIGKITISFKSSADRNRTMQIDLQQPLIIDSIVNEQGKIEYKKIDTNVYNAFLKDIGSKTYIDKAEGGQGVTDEENKIRIYYHGKPREAIRPPWDGGWIWK